MTRRVLKRLGKSPIPAKFHPWLGALGVHVLIILLLQASGGSSQAVPQIRSEVEAVQVQTLDEKVLHDRREAWRQAERQEAIEEKRRREEAQRLAAAKAREAKEREQERERKAARQREEAEAKRKREEDRRLAAAKAREAKEREQERERKAARQREEAEAKRKREEDRRLAAAKARESESRKEKASRRERQANIWRLAIEEKIKRAWLRPPALHRLPCEVEVEQNRKGEVLSARVLACPASKAWRESLRQAVQKASPLPPPPQSDLFDHKLIITFRPPESG